MRQQGESVLSIAFTLLVHALMGGALFITWDTDVRKFVPEPNVINATVLTVAESSAPATEAPKVPPKEEPKPAPAPKK